MDPPAPTSVQPNDVVLWNQSGPGLPMPVETVILQASGWPTNLTRARSASPTHPTSGMGVGMRHGHGTQIPMRAPSTSHRGPSTVPSSFEFALENGTAVEYHWQMRSIVDHRIGAWSTAAGFCVPMHMEPMTARRTTP